MIIVVYLVILVVAFFLLVVLPQRRRMTAQRAFIASLNVGDRVITSGGIYGNVVGLGDDTIDLQISPQVVVTVARGSVASRPRPSPETA